MIPSCWLCDGAVRRARPPALASSTHRASVDTTLAAGARRGARARFTPLLHPPLENVPAGDWFCPACTPETVAPLSAVRKHALCLREDKPLAGKCRFRTRPLCQPLPARRRRRASRPWRASSAPTPLPPPSEPSGAAPCERNPLCLREANHGGWCKLRAVGRRLAAGGRGGRMSTSPRSRGGHSTRGSAAERERGCACADLEMRSVDHPAAVHRGRPAPPRPAEIAPPPATVTCGRRADRQTPYVERLERKPSASTRRRTNGRRQSCVRCHRTGAALLRDRRRCGATRHISPAGCTATSRELAALERRAEAENAEIIFNGDFHS